MSRPEKEIFQRLGDEGLSRVLDDLMDQNRLVRLANSCGLKYPGMRTQSQERQRILSDLVERSGQQVTTRKAIYRALQKETKSAAREWNGLSPEEREERLKGLSLEADGKFGLHLYLMARMDDGGQNGFEPLIERLGPRPPRATPSGSKARSTRPSRAESRLKKQVQEFQNKIQHLDGQLAKGRESERSAKRDLIVRKGELAESRMLAERLQSELDTARAALEQAAKAPGKSGSISGEAFGELRKAIRKVSSEQKKLARTVDKLGETLRPQAGLESASLAPLVKTIKELHKDVAAIKRGRAGALAEQNKGLDELHTEITALRKNAARPPRRRIRTRGADARVGVFIDVQNMYYGARRLKGKLDFDALLEAAVLDRRLIQATAYVVESKEIDQTGFIAVLQQRAIEVRRKTLRVRVDGSMKGDWDMELALDILDAAANLDVVVLVSGDGDFTSLAKRVKRMGPRVEVIGFPRNTAKSLLEAADAFQPLDRKFMIYPDRTKNRPVPNRTPQSDKDGSAPPPK